MMCVRLDAVEMMLIIAHEMDVKIAPWFFSFGPAYEEEAVPTARHNLVEASWLA